MNSKYSTRYQFLEPRSIWIAASIVAFATSYSSEARTPCTEGMAAFTASSVSPEDLAHELSRVLDGFGTQKLIVLRDLLRSPAPINPAHFLDADPVVKLEIADHFRPAIDAMDAGHWERFLGKLRGFLEAAEGSSAQREESREDTAWVLHLRRIKIPRARFNGLRNSMSLEPVRYGGGHAYLRASDGKVSFVHPATFEELGSILFPNRYTIGPVATFEGPDGAWAALATETRDEKVLQWVSIRLDSSETPKEIEAWQGFPGVADQLSILEARSDGTTIAADRLDWSQGRFIKTQDFLRATVGDTGSGPVVGPGWSLRLGQHSGMRLPAFTQTFSFPHSGSKYWKAILRRDLKIALSDASGSRDIPLTALKRDIPYDRKALVQSLPDTWLTALEGPGGTMIFHFSFSRDLVRIRPEPARHWGIFPSRAPKTDKTRLERVPAIPGLRFRGEEADDTLLFIAQEGEIELRDAVTLKLKESAPSIGMLPLHALDFENEGKRYLAVVGLSAEGGGRPPSKSILAVYGIPGFQLIHSVPFDGGNLRRGKLSFAKRDGAGSLLYVGQSDDYTRVFTGLTR
jgi:hypothetical protein